MEKKLPKFFKVLIPGFRKKLRLPPLISKKLGRKEAAKRVTLISRRRGRSQVKIHRGKNGLLSFGRRGWKQFVDEHSLMVGDLLVFKHAGVGSLDVKVSIFDPTCCEKDRRRRRPPANPKTFSNGEGENDFNTKHVKVETRNGNGVKNKKLDSEKRDTKNGEGENDINTKHVKVETRNGNGAKNKKLDSEKRDTKRTSAARVKKRKVSITVKPYHIRKAGAYLPIPRSFCLANGIHKSQVVTLKGPSGIEHRARLMVYKSCAQISRGWLEFTESNNLNVGDTCVLKLRRRREESSSNGIVFRVKVSCAVN